jgi:hypothetical protein
MNKQLKTVDNKGRFLTGHKPKRTAESYKLVGLKRRERFKNDPEFAESLRKNLEKAREKKGDKPPWNKGKKYGSKSHRVLEHRLVMEEKLNRYLEPNELVHHRNGIKDDNRPENLELVIRKAHFGEVKCPYCRNNFLIR